MPFKHLLYRHYTGKKWVFYVTPLGVLYLSLGLGRLSKYFLPIILFFYSQCFSLLIFHCYLLFSFMLTEKMKDVVKTTQIITQINTIH